MNNREIYVSISLQKTTYIVGKLWYHFRNGRESASFEYDDSWLQNPERFELEPTLTLTKSSMHTPENHILFGSIGDSAPDRWGRILMRRFETIRAKKNNEAPHTLGEIDYLLGVNDTARQGALRFSLNQKGPYLNESDVTSIPPLIKLSELLSASEKFLDNNENLQDLKMLLTPGSSLGGARPKASIIDKDSFLSIAKFPKKDDESDNVKWEAVALTLAKNAKINIPDWRLETIMNKSVLILKRFDRNKEERIPFLSAMSMLQAKDNEPRSYLDILYSIFQYGAAPDKDSRELFRRIIFSILISNTDDHLRNHGFLYERQKGWRLSPVYDINPVPIEMKVRFLSTSIDYKNSEASLDTALSVAKDFRLSEEEAIYIIKDVSSAVLNWRTTAKAFGLPNPEIERMASAFEHNETKKAKKL